jgi:predicted polyphosphate/ATP-dependent NAD kinase
MAIERVGLLSNPYAGSGRDRVLALARDAFACVATQADVLVGPGDLGASATGGRGTVVGTDASRTRRDTIDTTRAMIERGAQLLVIVSASAAPLD